MGYDITVAHPQGYELASSVIQEAQRMSQQTGGRINFSHDLESAVKDTQVIYAKAWGPSSPLAPTAGFTHILDDSRTTSKIS